MSDLRINIHGRNDHNTIIEKEYPKFDDTSTRLKAEGGSCASKNNRIIFEPSAIKILFESIAWGTKYKRGDVEQAGILIGNYYHDGSLDGEVIWADVVIVIPADPSLVNASFETIDITAAAWKKMYENADEFRSENLQIVGWYHTHLDNINTRFSSVDRDTQNRAFTYQYSFGVVFNPNQKKWSAFCGPESQECVGELLFDEELLNKYRIPQITIRQVNGDSELQEDGSVVHFDEKGHPIENRFNNQEVTENIEDNKASFAQHVNQFRDEFMQLLGKPFKRGGSCKGKKLGRAQVPDFAPDNIPQIEIKSSEQIIPTVEGVICSMSTDNRLKCSITRSSVDEIMKYKRRRQKFLWGCVRKRNSNMEVLPVVSEKEANARIVFSKNNADDKKEELVAMGFRKSSKANIEYVVLIDDENSQSIDIHVIQYSRGK